MTKLGLIKNYEGQTISLNQKYGPYFGCGPMTKEGRPEIWLSTDDWYTELPKGLDQGTVDMITNGLRSNNIVLGKQWLPAKIKDTSVLEKYWLMAKGKPLKSREKEPFIELVKMTAVKNCTPLEILSYCLKTELETTHRKEWVSFFEAAIEAYTGPVQVVKDEPDEAYEVHIDLTEGTVKDSREPKVKKPIQSAKVSKRQKQLDKQKLDPDRAKAIDKALG